MPSDGTLSILATPTSPTITQQNNNKTPTPTLIPVPITPSSHSKVAQNGCANQVDADHSPTVSSSQKTPRSQLKHSQSSRTLCSAFRLFGKAQAKTNLSTIQKALYQALGGAANSHILEAMVKTIDLHAESCSHFLILFRDRQQFRGLYEYDEKGDMIKKLDGIGPKIIKNKSIEKYYKYDCPKRQFVEVDTKHISLTIIAFKISEHLWLLSNSQQTPKSTLKHSQSSRTLYNGPKLYGKPTAKSNLTTIQNALSQLLYGAANQATLQRILKTLESRSKTSGHFLVLIRGRQQFRGLYEFDDKANTISRLDGVGPKVINNSTIEKYYKYDCPKRQFVEVDVKHISLTITAFRISEHIWLTK